jgi:hypothetical protein
MQGPDAPQPDAAPADRSPESAPATAEPAEGAAVRDATAIAERVAADEAAADAEVKRLEREPLPVIATGLDTKLRLHRGEMLHAQRRAALLESPQEGPPAGGVLYLTSQRLVHAGDERTQEIPLQLVAEVAVSMERLLLVEMVDGSDLAIEVDQPRLLRVQVDAARGVTRGGGA